MVQSLAARSGLWVGDLVVSVPGEPIASTTSRQHAMVEDAIGRRPEITVWRNGEPVDVIAAPRAHGLVSIRAARGAERSRLRT